MIDDNHLFDAPFLFITLCQHFSSPFLHISPYPCSSSFLVGLLSTLIVVNIIPDQFWARCLTNSHHDSTHISSFFWWLVLIICHLWSFCMWSLIWCRIITCLSSAIIMLCGPQHFSSLRMFIISLIIRCASSFLSSSFLLIFHGSLNVPIEHHPTITYMVYNGYKVMSNIPKIGQLPTPVLVGHFSLSCLIMPDHPLRSLIYHLFLVFISFQCSRCFVFSSSHFSPSLHLCCILPPHCSKSGPPWPKWLVDPGKVKNTVKDCHSL